MKDGVSINKVINKGNIKSAFIDRVYKRGDLIEFYDEGNNGKSYKKLGVVVSKTKNNVNARFISVLIAFPGTTNYVSHAKIAHNYDPYCVLTEEVKRIETKKIIRFIRRLSLEEMNTVDVSLAYSLGLGKYIVQYEKPIRAEEVPTDFLIFEEDTSNPPVSDNPNNVNSGDDSDVS